MNLIFRLFLGVVFLMGLGQSPVFGKNIKIDSLENVISSSNDPHATILAYCKLARYYNKNAFSKTKYYLDKADKLCNETQSDSLKSHVLYTSGILYSFYDPVKAHIFYLEAAEYASKGGYLFLKSRIYNNNGSLFLKENELDSAEYYTLKSIKIKKNLAKQNPEDKLFIHSYGYSLLNMGSLYLNKSDYKIAISYLYDALEQAKKINDSSLIASVRLNIGVINYYYKDYDNALIEYKKVSEIAEKFNNIRLLASALTNIGAIYKAQEKWKEADSMFTAALLIRLETGPNSTIAGIYENLGIISTKELKYDKALDYYNKSLEIKAQRKNTWELAAIYSNMGNLFFLKKDYTKAERYMLMARENAIKAAGLEMSMEINISLSQLYQTKGDFKKALDYYKQFKIIDDSIHSLKSEETISLYKEKFKTAEKDRKISEFEQQQKLDALINEKQKLNNRLLTIGILAIVIISAFILLMVNNRRKTEKALFQKNNELNQQKMLELIKEQEMNSVNSFISGQERERSRIASDLHDRLGSLLSTVKLHFSSMEPFLEKDKELAENFSYAISLLDQSVAEVRSVSHNLAKEILTEFGIVGAIENLKEAINSAGNLKLVFINSGFNHRLPYEYEMEIYRIIQEIVTNAIKHASASEIAIQFVVDGDILTITIEDDGIGFDVSKIKSNGMGLKNIFERTAKMNGKYALDTTPGNGTTYIFDIPIGKDVDFSK